MTDKNKSNEVKFLHVPYSEKELVKQLGGRWNPSKRSWYCQRSEKKKFIKWWKEKNKIYIESDYDERSKVKELNGHWCKERRCWYGYATDKKLLESFSVIKGVPITKIESNKI